MHGVVKPFPQINVIISHIHNCVYVIYFIFTSPPMPPFNAIAIGILFYSNPSIQFQVSLTFPWDPNLYRSFIALTISFLKQWLVTSPTTPIKVGSVSYYYSPSSIKLNISQLTDFEEISLYKPIKGISSVPLYTEEKDGFTKYFPNWSIQSFHILLWNIKCKAAL